MVVHIKPFIKTIGVLLSIVRFVTSCVSLVEVTVENFRLLFLAETDLKSFSRCCDKLRQ